MTQFDCPGSRSAAWWNHLDEAETGRETALREKTTLREGHGGATIEETARRCSGRAVGRCEAGLAGPLGGTEDVAGAKPDEVATLNPLCVVQKIYDI